MKRIEKIRNAKNNIKQRIAFGVASASIALGSVGTVNAADFGTVNVNSKFDPITGVGKILGMLSWAVMVGGGAILIWGIWSLAQSIIQDRPESRSKAIFEIVGGGLAVGVTATLKALKIIT